MSGFLVQLARAHFFQIQKDNPSVQSLEPPRSPDVGFRVGSFDMFKVGKVERGLGDPTPDDFFLSKVFKLLVQRSNIRSELQVNVNQDEFLEAIWELEVVVRKDVEKVVSVLSVKVYRYDAFVILPWGKLVVLPILAHRSKVCSKRLSW